ncbi:MAG: nicotinate phosphoribosyltransferase [Actinomycetes bacterium]
MPDGPTPASSALLTDHYELTMLDAAVRAGTADRSTVFQCFARGLPGGRRYGVVAGLGRLLDLLERFTFGPVERDHLARTGVVSDETLDRLRDWRFTGRVQAYREGEVHLPGSPVLQVTAPFGEAVLLETLVLSVLNHDSAIATAGARMVAAAGGDPAAGGRPLLEFGARRTHEEAAVAAARAAWVVGFAGTSHLEAGRRHGIPTLGTVAHAFVMLHDTEAEAFAAQVAAAGAGTTALVDTYDTAGGIRAAVAAAGPGLGAIRIDSGDLAAETVAARALLDELGATDTRIVLSGDLDEHAIAALAAVPADGYGVGTELVTGSGHPTARMVYKLVARGEPGGPADVPVAKRSAGKRTAGGVVQATRLLDGGVATTELLTPHDAPPPPGGRALLVDVVVDGEVVHRPDLDEVRAHHRAAMAELPPGALDLAPGEPCIPTVRRDLP